MPLSVAQTTDLWHDGEDFSREMREVSGERAAAQRLLFRWTKSKDRKPFLGEGVDAREYILGKEPLWRIKVELESEGVRDEQIETCTVLPSRSDDLTQLLLDGFFSTKLGTFKFSMAITEAAGALIALQKAN